MTLRLKIRKEAITDSDLRTMTKRLHFYIDISSVLIEMYQTCEIVDLLLPGIKKDLFKKIEEAKNDRQDK